MTEDEFFDIATNVKAALSHKQYLAMRRDLTWLNYEEIPSPMGNGPAYSQRQIGRFMIMDKSDLFLKKLEQEINLAKEGLINPTVNIHIISGLCGRTGGGCFLDICYMVRHIANMMSVNCNTFGYFFLPDVSLAKVPEQDHLTRGYLLRSGYASMQELDHCMQFKYNGGAFEQEYKNGIKIKWDKPPVDFCHLIDATDSNGETKENSYQYSLNVVSEYIMETLTYTNGMNLLSLLFGCFRTTIGAVDGSKNIGAELGYCTIGGACATVPLREINTYLASKLFENFTAAKTTKPTETDLQQLAISSLGRGVRAFSGIYDSLHRELCDRADTGYQPYAQDWKYVRDNNNKDMVNHFTEQNAQKKGFIQTKTQSMMTPRNNASLIARVRTALLDIIRDVKKGPSYAFDMISASESHNLLNVIDGLIKHNEYRYQQEEFQTSIRRRDYEDSKNVFDTAKGLFSNAKGKFERYKFALENLVQNEIDVYAYEQMGVLLKTLREQIQELTYCYYTQFKRVTQTLTNTFEYNKRALEYWQPQNPLETQIVTVQELIPTLDNEVNSINLNVAWNDLITLFIDNEDEWIEEDKNKIAKLVTKFFVENVFSDFANKTITSFLEYKYGISDPTILANNVYRDWMTGLTQKSSPMFYFDRGIWDEAKTAKMASLSIPNGSPAIDMAAQNVQNMNNIWGINPSTLTDRVYAMNVCCVFPLCSNKNIGAWENEYYKKYQAGRHLYEGKDVPGMSFNDWRKLPHITL